MNRWRKGKRGELEVARLLYQAHYGSPPNPDRDVFVRTKGGVRQKEGDLVTPADFPFFVEVKNRSISLPKLLTSEWLKMLSETITKAKRKPILFCFKCQREWWVVTNAPIDAQLFIVINQHEFAITTLKKFCEWWQQKERNKHEAQTRN
ncbi:MAG: hypothetical protein RMK89_04265 [Armatimonadota bacterium]|nr:hypothetical protein [Armatimonadota bacterium]MCX7642878.1 hypothetical protein [Armatimonadota bacterium]MDW8142661.1 hypothetical protein [Armatimonadota bacterium]